MATKRAGRAAWRAVENTLGSLKAGRQALFLFLPEGEDPDSLVRAEGGHAFESRLDDAVPLSRFLFDHLTAGVDLTTPEGRARLVEASRSHIGKVPPGPYRRQLLMRLAELSGDASAIAPDRSARRRPGHPARDRASETPVRRAIRVLLHEPSLAAYAGGVAELRVSDVAGANLLADLVETLHARPDMTTGVLLERFREHEWSRWLEVLALSEPEISSPTGLREEFEGCLRLVLERAEHRRAQRRLDELTRRHPSELSDDERRELTELAARRSHGREAAPRRSD